MSDVEPGVVGAGEQPAPEVVVENWVHEAADKLEEWAGDAADAVEGAVEKVESLFDGGVEAAEAGVVDVVEAVAGLDDHSAPLKYVPSEAVLELIKNGEEALTHDVLNFIEERGGVHDFKVLIGWARAHLNG